MLLIQLYIDALDCLGVFSWEGLWRILIFQ